MQPPPPLPSPLLSPTMSTDASADHHIHVPLLPLPDGLSSLHTTTTTSKHFCSLVNEYIKEVQFIHPLPKIQNIASIFGKNGENKDKKILHQSLARMSKKQENVLCTIPQLCNLSPADINYWCQSFVMEITKRIVRNIHQTHYCTSWWVSRHFYTTVISKVLSLLSSEEVDAEMKRTQE